MRSRRVGAPAKLNLGLRVCGRRRDGYHALESVFVPLDLADEIGLEVEDADEAAVELALAGEAEGVPGGEQNLAVRAARAFAAAAGLRCRVRIRLDKRIPVAAGLGGGSSDAGAVLRTPSQLFPDAVQAQVLADLALGLGAAVPFFLDPRPARVRGVGEQLEPLSGVPALAVLLVGPGLPLATARVYEAFDALQPAPASDLAASRPPAFADVPWRAAPGPEFAAALERLLENDLEPAAVRLCPPIARLRQRLRAAGALAVGLSGSGPTLFGVFADAARAEAGRVRAALEPPSWARVAVTLESR